MTGLDTSRIRAVVRKELRDYRRNRFIVVSMGVLPAVFLALPIADIFSLPASLSSARLDKLIGLSLLFMLLIPVLVPATVAGYAVVGEREQGTLEPLLTTPIRQEELLIGKAAAAMIPAVAIAYAAFGIFLLCGRWYANSAVASAVFRQSSLLVAQAVFTPLLAGWAIWVGMAVSARSSDVRVAQQLATLGSFPPLAVTALMSFRVINPTLAIAFVLAVALLAIDLLGWRVVSAMFDRERLVT
jgi:ABC-2 type transport system permease protein